MKKSDESSSEDYYSPSVRNGKTTSFPRKPIQVSPPKISPVQLTPRQNIFNDDDEYDEDIDVGRSTKQSDSHGIKPYKEEQSQQLQKGSIPGISKPYPTASATPTIMVKRFATSSSSDNEDDITSTLPKPTPTQLTSEKILLQQAPIGVNSAETAKTPQQLFITGVAGFLNGGIPKFVSMVDKSDPQASGIANNQPVQIESNVTDRQSDSSHRVENSEMQTVAYWQSVASQCQLAYQSLEDKFTTEGESKRLLEERCADLQSQLDNERAERELQDSKIRELNVENERLSATITENQSGGGNNNKFRELYRQEEQKRMAIQKKYDEVFERYKALKERHEEQYNNIAVEDDSKINESEKLRKKLEQLENESKNLKIKLQDKEFIVSQLQTELRNKVESPTNPKNGNGQSPEIGMGGTPDSTNVKLNAQLAEVVEQKERFGRRIFELEQLASILRTAAHDNPYI